MQRTFFLIAAMVLASASWALAAEPVKPDADAKVNAALEKNIKAVDFHARPVFEAFDILAEAGAVNIILDPKKVRFDRKVSFEGEDLALRNAIEEITKKLELAWDIRDGVIFVSDAETLKNHPAPGPVFAAEKPSEADLKAAKELDERMVTFQFLQQSVPEVLDFLQLLGKVNIVPDGKSVADPDRQVSISLRDVSLRQGLRLITDQADLRWVIRDGIVMVSDEAGIKTLIGKKESVFASRKPTDADRELAKTLEGTTASFDFHEQPAGEAFEFLRTLGKVEMQVDREAVQQKTITLRLTDVPLSTALTLASEQIGLRWSIENGKIVLREAKK